MTSTLATILLFVGCFLVLTALWQTITYVYLCEKCNCRFKKPFVSNLVSPFRYSNLVKENKRYFKCPQCNKFGWHKIIEKK